MGLQRKKVLGELAAGMANITGDVKIMLDLSFKGFLNNKEELIKECSTIIERIDERVAEIAVMVPVLELEEREEITKILSIINNLESIKYNVIKIMNQTQSKISEGILFTNKAVMELKELFESVLALIDDLNDMLMTENKVLIKHVIDTIKEIENTVQKYATEHEERLIIGECLPKSSTLYLLTLDSLRDILWHIKTIARELAY
ncbi:MAG: hypothetical protein CVU88_02695 [Firmicutes bacterium HGW-Firmicutes-13]|nr:MAG: hypothetical protein CVU88_02695 [Firmicutes bacterium HGW-Firmicutes-13]